MSKTVVLSDLMEHPASWRRHILTHNNQGVKTSLGEKQDTMEAHCRAFALPRESE